MAEFIWQKNVVRLISFLTCLGVLVILVGVIVIYSQPGESSSPDAVTIAAVPLVLLAAAALLVFYLGVLIERQNLTEKLPTVTLFRVASVAVLTVMVVPAKNVAFTLLLFICFMAVVLQIFSRFGASLRLRLAFVAFSDAVFNLASAEATRWAGAAGDIAVARFNMALFAGVGGAFIPLAQLLALRLPIPNLCKATCVAYGALAVHSALILLQALGTEVTFLFNGGGLYFEGPSCVISNVESPLSLVLGALTSFSANAAAARSSGSEQQTSCPENLVETIEGDAAIPLTRVHICPETPIEALLFFVTLGALFGGLFIIFVWNRHAPQPSHREMPESFSDAKRRRGLLAGACVMVSLVLVVVFGVLGMGCPSEPEVLRPQVSMVNGSNGTNAFDMNSSDPTGRQLQSTDNNDTNGTNDTMDEVSTTTPSPVFENYTQAEIQAAEAVLYTLHGDFTGKCIIPTGEEPTYRSADAPGSSCQLLCSLREDCYAYSQDRDLETCLLWNQTGLTGHGNGAGLWKCVTKQQVPRSRECEASDLVVVDGRIIEEGPAVQCGCSGAFDRGLWGPVSGTAEQVASVWCNIGMAAPFMFGLAGFLVHSFACSVAVEYLSASEHRVTMRSLVNRQVRPIDDGEGEVEHNQSIVAWSEAPRDENPKPVAQFGTNRMFSV